MKSVIAALALVIATGVMAEPAKQTEAVQNDKCVKKDKNGKCPELPKSPKPTPKKVEGK